MNIKTRLICLQLKYASLRMRGIRDKSAIVNAPLASKQYRQSPIVQGGMEIPCEVTVKMWGTCINLMLIEKYKQLVEQLYIESNSEEILGSFLEPNENIDDFSISPSAKKNPK